MMSPYVLRLSDVSLSFNSTNDAFFSGLDLALRRGELSSLRGKNGSGKSTLFKILRGSLDSTFIVKGSATVMEKTYLLEDTAATSRALKRSVALVSQRYDAMIADAFSFRENLSFAAFSPFPAWMRPLRKPPQVPAFIHRFGIDDNTPVKLLSGGQRQILALLMVLQRQPSILLLDEPTATMDSCNARMVFDFVAELVAGGEVTALVISHDDDLVQEYCQGTAFELQVDALTQRRSLQAIPKPVPSLR